MSNLDFIKKLYNGKNCYSDHMDAEELDLLHISSRVETILVDFLSKGKIVFLTGNPGDGKTFMIRKNEEAITALNTYIETDLNKVSNYLQVAKDVVECYQTDRSAVIAVNEYQFYQLCKSMKDISNVIYNEIMQVKKESIIYDIPKNGINKIVVIDLNERSLLNNDMQLAEDILNKIHSLLVQDNIHDKRLIENISAIANVNIKQQMLALVNLATTSCEHFTVRDILGAFSFIVTACITDEYTGKAYYDAIFTGSNSLLKVIQQFDPIFLSKVSLDESLWNGEIIDGWLMGVPEIWPNSIDFEDDVEGAIDCFKSLKRRYYFENVAGKDLMVLQPDEIVKSTETFTNFESQRKKIKEKLIRSLNKLFLPTSEEKKQLRIWTTHRYDLSREASTAISSRYIDASELEILMPRPADWLNDMEYMPNHIIIKPRELETPILKLDVDFLRTLDAVEKGYPVALLAPQYEHTAARFLRRLDDNKLTEENDDGEILIASRSKSYKKSIYIQENKYSFEGED